LKAFVGVLDRDYFNFLACLAGIDEVNFWQPEGKSFFAGLGSSCYADSGWTSLSLDLGQYR
jgi:hypothetical protein